MNTERPKNILALILRWVLVSAVLWVLLILLVLQVTRCNDRYAKHKRDAQRVEMVQR